MIKLYSLLSVWLVLLGEILSSEPEDCAEFFSSKTQPRLCCDFPHRHIPETTQEKCKKACDNIEDKTGGCCIINCNYHKTGVVVDSKFDESALLELYENYLTEKGAGKFDQWLPIIAESIATCYKLYPKSDKIYTCDIPEFVLDILDCVGHFNFKNCPKYIDSVECKDLRKFVDTLDRCGKEVNGTFIIDYTFFDEQE